MKTLKCDLCEVTAKGDTFEEWLNNLKPHYAEFHADLMKQQSEKTKEEQQAEMTKWMAQNKARFNTA